MMGKSAKIIWIVLIAVFIVFILKPVGEVFWAQWMGFVAPSHHDFVLKKWERKDTDFLLRKLQHPSNFYSGIASSVLAGKKDLAKEEKLIRIIKSRFIIFPHVKTGALGVLFYWDEAKAIAVSMEILRTGKTHPLYGNALRHLARRKYDPAYPYVLDLAKGDDPLATGVVKFLEDYGKSDAIPILEAMLAKVRTQDELVAKIDHRRILEAMESIKRQNNLLAKGSQGVSNGYT